MGGDPEWTRMGWVGWEGKLRHAYIRVLLLNIGRRGRRVSQSMDEMDATLRRGAHPQPPVSHSTPTRYPHTARYCAAYWSILPVRAFSGKPGTKTLFSRECEVRHDGRLALAGVVHESSRTLEGAQWRANICPGLDASRLPREQHRK